MRLTKFLVLITIMAFNNKTITSQNANDEIIYNPIGIFHCFFNPNTGAPRQGILSPEITATIEIYEPYRDGLANLSDFEYIIVLYHFHEVRSWEPIIYPPGSDTIHKFGVFSTRSPKRPNEIGFSIVKLNKIENGILYVSGVDAFDNSPVLDIKPYLPSIDCIKSTVNSNAEIKYGHHDEIFINDSIYFK